MGYQQDDHHDFGWLVFTVTMGGIAAIYGFLKRANHNLYSSSSYLLLPLDDMAYGSSFTQIIFHLLKSILLVDDPNSCCCKNSNGDQRYPHITLFFFF